MTDRRHPLAVAAVMTAVALLTTSCASAAPAAAPPVPNGTSRFETTAPEVVTPVVVPTTARPTSVSDSRGITPPKHVVVVVLENHSQSQIIGNSQAPYVNHLASKGALYTRAYATTHPSQPNYIVLLAGSTLGVSGDSCPNRLTAPNLASQLRAAGRSFAGYAEGLPHQGWAGCIAGAYARKHVPWVNFTNLPPTVNRPLSAFPTRFRSLPTLSFVIPDLKNDMHDGSVATGDRWVRHHLGAYARWAARHDSLLLVTFDEDDYNGDNHIATIAYGARVRTGPHPTRIDHCRVLGTLESLYGLAPLGCAAGTRPIKSIWHR